MNDYQDTERFGDIAIIGMAGRFPGAANVEEFWRNICAGVESISFFTDEELKASGIDEEASRHPHYVKARGVLEGVELFDSAFFGYNPREAEILDPQQRLFLECAWEALESAGYDSMRYGGRIGVFAGAAMNTYLLNIISNRQLFDFLGGFQIMIANDKDYVPTRVSYKLNLKGPSVNVQTACSTSLVAIHMAYQSLLSGECDMALAGAVAVAVPQKQGYLYTEGGIHSPDGHCRAFDVNARGTLDGSGLGIVVLKRFDAALEDGDQIHAVIRGSSINNDGSDKVGFTAPSEVGQSHVVAESLSVAGIEPETISYVETHGTGTTLGDPIEIAALTQAFRARTEKKNFCAIGSVKTNIGHLGVAAGMAGLIKTVMALKERTLPPSLHFTEPNPALNLDESPFFVNAALSEWKPNGTPLRAGVSSFGIGGTNAHVILEEAPEVNSSGADSRPYQLILLSARTESALETATANLARHLSATPALNLADVAYTLQVGRRAFRHRRMLVCETLDEAATALETLDPTRLFSRTSEEDAPSVVYMFPGGGAQYTNMGVGLYEKEATFRREVDECCEILRPILGVDLRDLLYASEEETEEATRRLRQTTLGLPALFVTSYATAKLWMEWGVIPEAMIGHSLGEYVAACLAGIFSLEDALALVALRGKLFDELPRGAMLGVALPEQELRALIGSDLSLAVVNGPSQCVASGEVEPVRELAERLTARGIEVRFIEIDTAAHSQMVDAILPPFHRFLDTLRLSAPKIPIMSNLSGTWLTDEEATSPQYWVRHLRETVRFKDGVAQLLGETQRIMLEVGPGRTLSTLTKLQKEYSNAQTVLTSLRHPYDKVDDQTFLLSTLGDIWMAGGKVNWSGFYRDEQRRRVTLPTYPFERERYWVEPKEQPREASAKPERISKRSDVSEWFYLPTWKATPAPFLLEQDETIEHRTRTLLFAHQDNFSARLQARLVAEGREVITVVAGECFAKTDTHTFIINPACSEDYEKLIAELLTTGETPSAIIHTWSVTPREHGACGAACLDAHQERGFYSLLHLARALASHAVYDPLKIIAVSSDVHEITGDETLAPGKATLLGPCRVIPQEYPNVTCLAIDIVTPASGSQQEESVATYLVAELRARAGERVIAYRNGRRWEQAFMSVRPPKLENAPSPFRERGVYLISGGLGGVGLTLAEHLARTVRARLVLFGSTPLPSREDWPRILQTHGDADPLAVKLRRVLALEEAGAETLVVQADVADPQQLQALVRETLARFGTIHGVFHTAGVVGHRGVRTIEELKRDEAEAQFRPKVAGLYALEEALRGIELDFCALTSSLAAVLGGLGFATYAAANTFMDAFVHCHNRTGAVQWMSINSDVWHLREDAVVGETLAQLPMTIDEGLEAFARALLLKPSPQTLISTGELQARINQWVNREPQREQERRGEAKSANNTYTRPALRNAYVAPRQDVELVITAIWEDRLGINGIGVYDNFFDLGGQSLLATQVISALRDTFQIEIPLRALFEQPTIAGMAETIEELCRGAGVSASKVAEVIMQLENMSDEEVQKMLMERGT